MSDVPSGKGTESEEDSHCFLKHFSEDVRVLVPKRRVLVWDIPETVQCPSVAQGVPERSLERVSNLVTLDLGPVEVVPGSPPVLSRKYWWSGTGPKCCEGLEVVRFGERKNHWTRGALYPVCMEETLDVLFPLR